MVIKKTNYFPIIVFLQEMNHPDQILKLIEEFGKASNSKIDYVALQKAKTRFQLPLSDDFSLFYKQLHDIGTFANFSFELRTFTREDFKKLSNKLTHPLIYIDKNAKSLVPVLLKHFDGKKFETIQINENNENKIDYENFEDLFKSIKNVDELIKQNQFNAEQFIAGNENAADFILVITGFKIGEILNSTNLKKPTPFQRFLSLLRAEKRDIKYIYFFAILIALINLALPLGVQAIVGLISGGLLLESVVILITMVILATALSGYLQIQQLKMVEILQQRVFANVTFEFAWRLPRIKIESLLKHYTPEMVNRFFDVLNVQKSLPKILIDLTAALIQILFGLLLLSMYHPIFIGFGFLIVFIIIIIFYTTGVKALETSIYESKYKYKVAYWLQEIGRSINSFKLAGNSHLPIHKSDHLLANYLKYRNKHFAILVKQYASIVSFKTLITALLLVLGSLLVVNREINLGQFVAAELIIVLIITSVEKLISTIEVAYDLLTALDKIGHVTDLEIESNEGRELHDLDIEERFNLKTNNISFKYPNSRYDVLSNVNFEINKGERICITGYSDSGKTTFIKTISGLYTNYLGTIMLNDVSIKELNIDSYRSVIGDNLSQEDLFEGTIEENIVMGRAGIAFRDLIEAIKKAGLHEFISNLNEGLQSNVSPGGINFPKGIIQKIVLARSFVQKPKLLIIDDFFYNMSKKDNTELLNNLFDNKSWSIIIISSQPSIMKLCDRICVLSNGQIIENGTYDELLQRNILAPFLNE